jgi:hypothetical protein
MKACIVGGSETVALEMTEVDAYLGPQQQLRNLRMGGNRKGVHQRLSSFWKGANHDLPVPNEAGEWFYNLGPNTSRAAQVSPGGQK